MVRRRVRADHYWVDLPWREGGPRIINAISYASGNGAAQPWIKPKIIHDPAIYAPEEILARCEFVEDICEATELMDEYWKEIKSK